MKQLNCQEVQAELSAYHDGEVSETRRKEIETHLLLCSDCNSQLQMFQQLSVMVTKLPPVEAPDRWNKLAESPVRNIIRPETPSHGFRRKAIRYVSAALSIAFCVGILVWLIPRDHHQHDVSVAFGAYLDEFANNPESADRLLTQSYRGTSVSFQEAVDSLGYRPVMVDHMPPGYSLVQAQLLRMPCCECLQATFSRNDGRVICVFEHDRNQSDWLKGRPVVSTQCDNTTCRMTQVDGHLAATWERGQRLVTVVGLQSIQELSLFVTHFGK